MAHLTVALQTLNTPLDTQIGEIIQSMAAEAGITVKLHAGETVANIAAMKQGNFQTALTIWSGRSDPDFNITQYLSCDGFQNWTKYCNPTFQTLLDKARSVTDPAQRQELYHQVAATYIADRPISVPVPHDLAVRGEQAPGGVHAGARWADPAARADAAIGSRGPPARPRHADRR